MTASILAVEIRDELYAIIRDPVAALFSIAMPVGSSRGNMPGLNVCSIRCSSIIGSLKHG